MNEAILIFVLISVACVIGAMLSLARKLNKSEKENARLRRTIRILKNN